MYAYCKMLEAMTNYCYLIASMLGICVSWTRLCIQPLNISQSLYVYMHDSAWFRMILRDPVRSCSIPHDPAWFCVIPHASTRFCIILYNPLRFRAIPHDSIQLNMILYTSARPCMILAGSTWFSRFRRFRNILTIPHFSASVPPPRMYWVSWSSWLRWLR